MALLPEHEHRISEGFRDIRAQLSLLCADEHIWNAAQKRDLGDHIKAVDVLAGEVEETIQTLRQGGF